ncbi:unnamed protein product, partial [Prorocentrum cordatum]
RPGRAALGAPARGPALPRPRLPLRGHAAGGRRQARRPGDAGQGRGGPGLEPRGAVPQRPRGKARPDTVLRAGHVPR